MPNSESIIHLAVKDLVPNRFGPAVNPPISAVDLLALESSIERDGIRVPLVVWANKGSRVVIAGNNRFRIAGKLGMETVPAVIQTFASETQARLYAMTDNLARRHMNTAQRAELALELQRLLTVGQGRRTDAAKPSSILKKVDSWAQAAKLAGVAVGTISDMRRVIDHGDKALLEKVRSGSVKASAASNVIREMSRVHPMHRSPVLPDAPVFSCIVADTDELIGNVVKLYLRPGMRIADVTYGKGLFWRRVDMSKYDFHPSDIATTEPKRDFRRLDYADGSFDVVVVDPPFLPNTGGPAYYAGIRYRNQESDCRNYDDVISLYRQAMKECWRILKGGGQMWVKCKDGQRGDKQVMTHIAVHDIAIRELSMAVYDLFILRRKQQPMMRFPTQRYSRKNHSYLWVFAK